MVKLENIIDRGNVIVMDCLIEGDRNDCFTLSINKQNLQIVECSRDGIRIYAGHVRQYMKKILENKEIIPRQATVMWC